MRLAVRWPRPQRGKRQPSDCVVLVDCALPAIAAASLWLGARCPLPSPRTLKIWSFAIGCGALQHAAVVG